MEMVADRLWLVSDGSVAPFDGDMDDYAKFVLDRARKRQQAGGEGAEPGLRRPHGPRRPRAPEAQSWRPPSRC